MNLIKGDIATLDLDCIVNAANEDLMPGGGVCGAIHQAAGKELAMECKKIGHYGVGEVRITNGYDLKPKHVIHTVGPIWYGGDHSEDQYLFNCYKKSLLLATYHSIESIAFPNIRTGIYGYPKELAAEIAIASVKQHQSSVRRLKEVIFCCFDNENHQLYDELLNKD
tara:strand:+ start:655 stop:1155 length:501 start_codon:yes stop_codon:yes gene_type:complete